MRAPSRTDLEALAGHRFHVLALDGNRVPTPGDTDILLLGPGERVDAFVEMNHPVRVDAGLHNGSGPHDWHGHRTSNMPT